MFFVAVGGFQLWPWVVVYRGVHPPVTNSRALIVDGGFQTSKTDSDGLIGRFSSLKPDSLEPTIKPNKIWKLQAFFWQVFGENSSYQTRFLPDLGEISPIRQDRNVGGLIFSHMCLVERKEK